MPIRARIPFALFFLGALLLLSAIVLLTYDSASLLAVSALSLIGLALLVAFAFELASYVTARRRTEQRLSEERNELERRVRERTAELQEQQVVAEAETARAHAAAYDAEVAATRMAEILRDLTAVKRDRQATEQQYRSLVEQVRDYAIFRMEPDGTAASWNVGVERVLGYSEGEFIGLPVESIFTPEDIAARVPWDELETARTRGTANDDRWMRRKDGTSFFANGATTVLEDEDGNLIGFSKVMRDETTAKLIEDALRKSEAKYRLVARASREAIWDWNLETGRMEWNDGLEGIFGHQPDAVKQNVDWWMEQMHPEDRERVRESIEASIQGSDEFWSADYRFLRQDGHYAQVSDRGLLERTYDGKVTRILGTMSDQTDRRRTEEKLAQAQRMESVGRLAGGIAHDLNNMLTAIVGYSSFLADDLPDSDRRRADVLEILKAAERSAGLTRSLLAFARREIIQPEHLDMNLVIRDMSRMLRPALGENIELLLDLNAEPTMVYADRARVEQVLLNLVLNARDAMPRGGRLMIASGNVVLGSGDVGRHPGTEIPAGNYLRIAVSDTGLGMNPETLARVFEPFFTTKPVGEGTGLGLATAYGTIKQSRGFIWAYSEPGHGSAFHVYLPETRTTAKVEDIFERTRPTRLGGSETVLVVEDEEVVRELAARSLRSEGYTAITAAGAREALELLRQRKLPVSLVITDLVMPGTGGRELAEQIRHHWPETPILFTSGFTDDDVIRRGLMDSGEPFLQKPWGPDSLLRVVRSLLDQGATELRPKATDRVRPGAKRGAG